MEPVSSKYFECWNPNCPRYAGFGERLRLRDVYKDDMDQIRCCACDTMVQQAKPSDERAKSLAGTAGGALLGWAVGGPAGAIIGGVIGFIVSGSTVSYEDKD